MSLWWLAIEIEIFFENIDHFENIKNKENIKNLEN